MGLNRSLCLVFPFFLCLQSWSQVAPPNGQPSTGANSYHLGVAMGSIAPYDIPGVRELLPTWGIKFGHDFVDSVRFEYDLHMSNAKGVSYYLAYFNIRYDFLLLDKLPLFALIGGDFHHYKRKNTLITNSEFPFQTRTGWHTGVGAEVWMFAKLWLRIDFRLGFGPGRQLLTTGGVIFHF